MDYKKRFIEAYMEAQLKDAGETMKWASNKMNSYADEFSAVINGKPMKDTPFIIAIMETMAKGLRQKDNEYAEIADALEDTFTGVMISKE